jgi:hypothetical protein
MDFLKTTAGKLIVAVIIIIVIIIVYGMLSKEGLSAIPDVSNRLYGVIPTSITGGISVPRSRAF